MSGCLIILDSNALIHRAYHALPALATKKGEIVNAVYGFLLVFLKAIREFQPDYVTACFDLPVPTFRHLKFKEYKAKRPKAPDDLYQQIPKVKKILESFNVPIYEKPGFEADDLIASLKVKAPAFAKATAGKQNSKLKIIIISGDLDLLQLVDEQTRVYTLRKGIKDTVLYDENLVKERYQGLVPSQLADFRALRGDPSDNIPGVPGIGEKTAIKLIQEFGSLENLYENLYLVPNKLKIKLAEGREKAFLSKDLAQIEKDAPIDFDLEKCRFNGYDKEKAINALKELEFYSLINRLP